MGGCSNTPPPSGRGKSRGPSGRGLKKPIAYPSIHSTNEGQLANYSAKLVAYGANGLGYRAPVRLSYPARHTPLSPT